MSKSLDPDVAGALKHSCDGRHLISYADLPAAWHNNPHISTGYRFIPLNRYPALLYSIFTPHNEFLNIQTHLLPFLLWGATFRASDPAEAVFTACVLICLGSSVVWHTMSGCAHRGTMKFCARVDYVGIGWLISASIGTIVYYGYAAHPHLAYPFLALCPPHGSDGEHPPLHGVVRPVREPAPASLLFPRARVLCRRARRGDCAPVRRKRDGGFCCPPPPDARLLRARNRLLCAPRPRAVPRPRRAVGAAPGAHRGRLARDLARVHRAGHSAVARGAERFARGCRRERGCVT
ncbi:hypothetical protein B0H14DRAFT_1616759 [Mycena olivaceomarginata]|nr:hypothetical protein B0H14DRAFT_1616759 [Mycena olivaceomarginata]